MSGSATAKNQPWQGGAAPAGSARPSGTPSAPRFLQPCHHRSAAPQTPGPEATQSSSRPAAPAQGCQPQQGEATQMGPPGSMPPPAPHYDPPHPSRPPAVSLPLVSPVRGSTPADRQPAAFPVGPAPSSRRTVGLRLLFIPSAVTLSQATLSTSVTPDFSMFGSGRFLLISFFGSFLHQRSPPRSPVFISLWGR